MTLTGTLKNIPAEQAAKKMAPGRNSIWEIVNHLISWRLNVLQRVQGKVITTPGNNYFAAVKDVSETAWKKTLKELDNSQEQWLDLLKKFDRGDFEKVYPNNKMTWYEHIQGILQHDAYHLGQIVLLTKLF